MNLLVTGAMPDAQSAVRALEAMGHHVTFLQYEKDPLPCDAAWVEGIVGNGIFLSHPIDQFVNLRLIQLTSAGFDRVPMDYVRAHGITIFNARGVYSIPMAEFAIAGVLQLYKQAAFFSAQQRAQCWLKHRQLLELNGRCVCIVGCGSVGTACAIRFKAFGCRVTGVDLYPRDDIAYDEMLPLAQLDACLPSADVVILTLPLTEETRHLMNRARLMLLRPEAVLVNIARGAVVDEQALTEALRENRLYGAVLDVFETEPLPEQSELWGMERVLVTPHNSFVSDANAQRLLQLVLDNIRGI